MSDKLTEEQMDQVIERLFDRLENDAALQQRLIGMALKGIDFKMLAQLGNLFGGLGGKKS